MSYTITEKDVAGPFAETIPDDYREKRNMKELGYTSPVELLAEKFHMSQDLLRKLNPDADFGRAGQEIMVASVERRANARRRLGSRSRRARRRSRCTEKTSR